MKTLVYLGCHEGYSLKNILKNYNFDKILLVEADPDTYKRLLIYTNNKSNIITVNKCVVSDKNIKNTKFYRTVNDGASNSIHKPIVGDHFIKDEITIDAVYLPDLLKEHNIDEIDLYISDLQGNDFNVLQSINYMLISGKIKELFLETFNENYNFYNTNNNKIQNYYELLNTFYKIDYMSADSTVLTTADQIVSFMMNNGAGELDVHWSLKSKDNINYFVV